MPEACRNCFQVIALNDDIAVGNDEDIVTCLIQHVDQVRYLAVSAVLPRTDHQPDIEVRKRGDQIANGRDCGVAGIGDPANDLHRAWVILRAEPGQVAGQPGLGATQRLENGNGRITCRRHHRRAAELTDSEGRGQGIGTA